MAFAAFADAPIDMAVVEVGLGGRWDATNVVDAPVAVITPIGVDHADYLGDTIAEIAGEKAGIITDRRRPVRRHDRHRRGDRPSAARSDGGAPGAGGARRRRGGARGFGIRGARQADRRRRTAARTAGPRRDVRRDLPCLCTANIRRTTRWSRWPRSRRSSARARSGSWMSTRCGRVSPLSPVPAGWSGCAVPQPFSSTPRTIPAGAAALGAGAEEEFDFRFLVGVVSVMADKDVDGILAALEPVLDQIVVTHNGSPRALDVEALAIRAEERFGHERVITAQRCPTRSRPPPRSSRRPETKARASVASAGSAW